MFIALVLMRVFLALTPQSVLVAPAALTVSIALVLLSICGMFSNVRTFLLLSVFTAVCASVFTVFAALVLL